MEGVAQGDMSCGPQMLHLKKKWGKGIKYGSEPTTNMVNLRDVIMGNGVNFRDLNFENICIWIQTSKCICIKFIFVSEMQLNLSQFTSYICSLCKRTRAI